MRNNQIMTKIFFFSLFFFFFSLFSLSAFGKKDTEESDPINDEWILCVTAFDYTQLPQSQRIAGDVITRSLVDKLRSVNYRLRLSPEYAYYAGYAWQQSVKTAAKAVSSKRDERSQLLYRGDASWKYRNNLKKIDADLEKLLKTLAEKEAEKPLVDTEPVFGLSKANIEGTYPEPPKAGTERRFCRGQNSDAFLTGEIREFHGRYYIRLRLYILYVNSYVYEDDIIFSMEDTDGAVEEITTRLTAVLSGNRPAVIAVQADPPESQVLINRNFAGRGSVEAREQPPGKVVVAVAAEGFSPEMVETELMPGERINVSVSLIPLLYSEVTISVPGYNPASGTSSFSVYQGALYVGEAPLTLRLPLSQLEYISVENGSGETAQAVFTSPDMPGEVFDVSLKAKLPPPGEKRVNKARSGFYWAWGGTWVAGILAWVTYGIYTSQNEALAQSYDYGFYDNTVRMYYVSTGAMIALGAVLAYDVFQVVRYISTSNEKATPIVK